MKEETHMFVVCAYKESPYLKECLLSLKRQTVKSPILMITSTPNAFIRKTAEKYGIPLSVNPRGGIVEDWNYAYERAEARYVTIAHQDDIYFPEYTREVLGGLARAEAPLICFTDYCEIRKGKRTLSNRLLRIKRLLLLPLRLRRFSGSRLIKRLVLSFGCPICCPSVVFVKERIEKEPFTAGFLSNEDWEAWERLSRKKGQFIYVPKPLVGHRIHEGSETTRLIGDEVRGGEDYEMFRKFWPPVIARGLTRLYASGEKSNELS